MELLQFFGDFRKIYQEHWQIFGGKMCWNDVEEKLHLPKGFNRRYLRWWYFGSWTLRKLIDGTSLWHTFGKITLEGPIQTGQAYNRKTWKVDVEVNLIIGFKAFIGCCFLLLLWGRCFCTWCTWGASCSRIRFGIRPKSVYALDLPWDILLYKNLLEAFSYFCWKQWELLHKIYILCHETTYWGFKKM